MEHEVNYEPTVGYVRAADADPHCPDYTADHRVSSVAVRFRWSMPLLCRSCSLPCCARVDNGSLRSWLVMLVTMRLGRVPLDLRHYGRYFPEGQLLWHVQDWLCWLCCNSRCLRDSVEVPLLQSLRFSHRQGGRDLRRGDFAAFCCIFRTPSSWT